MNPSKLNSKQTATLSIVALGAYALWSRRFKIKNFLIEKGVLTRYVQSDQEGHYDIDGVSLTEDHVVVASALK